MPTPTQARPRAPQFFTVPKGTRAGTCRTCDHPIFWIVLESGRKMPVDCEVDGAYPPTATDDGQGVSHFATCPHANQHRRKR